MRAGIVRYFHTHKAIYTRIHRSDFTQRRRNPVDATEPLLDHNESYAVEVTIAS
jgi:hypothetical protein